MLSREHKILLFLILLLAFTFRAVPFFAGNLIGPDPFFHSRMAEQAIEEQGVPEYDSLSEQGREYSYAPLFHTIFATVSIFSSLHVSLLILLIPALYGTFSVLIAFIFGRKLFGTKIGLFSAFLLAIMHLHVQRTMSYARPDSLALLLVPAIVYLVYTKRYEIAGLMTIGLVLLHPLSSLNLFAFLLFWAAVAHVKKMDISKKKILAIIFIGTLVWLLWLFSLGLDPSIYVSKVSMQSTEMKGLKFYDVFYYFSVAWIFIIMAIFKLKDKIFLKIWFVFTFIIAVLALRLAIFFTIPAALVAGFGFDFLLRKTKPYTKVFFGLVLLLFVVSQVPGVSYGMPFVSDSEQTAMLWMNQNTPIDSNILSLWDKGHPLAYLAERPVVVDGYFEFAHELNQRIESANTVAGSSDCNKVWHALKEFNSNYFFVSKRGIISPSLKNGILEANDCNYSSLVYSSDGAKIIMYQ